MTLEAALEAAVAALSGVIVVLWRRDVKRSDREADRVAMMTDRLLKDDDQ